MNVTINYLDGDATVEDVRSYALKQGWLVLFREGEMHTVIPTDNIESVEFEGEIRVNV